MKLTYEDYDDLSVLALRGDLNSDQSDQFRRAILERIDANIRDFVIDATSLEFVDSKGLESLLWLQEQVAERLGQIRLACVQDNVKQILDITRLAARFDRHEDVDAAIKSLR